MMIRNGRPTYSNDWNFNNSRQNWNVPNPTMGYSNFRPRFQAHPPITNAMRCVICHRFGHLKNNCRTRLRACFLCGDRNHFIRECPRKNEGFYSLNRPSRQRFRSVSPQRGNKNSQMRNFSQQRMHSENSHQNSDRFPKNDNLN